MSRTRCGRGGRAHAGAPPGGRRGRLAGVVGSELEEHLLEPGALGGLQLDQHDPGRRSGAADVDRLHLAAEAAVTGGRASMPAPLQRPLQRGGVRRLHVGAGRLQQLGAGALRDDLAAADHDQLVGDHLDLVEQVGGEQHGATVGGELAQHPAHPVDAGRVEAVDGLVEDQDRRVAEHRVGDAEALAHAEGVVAHPALGLGAVEADELEHLLDPLAPDAHRLGAEPQHLAAGAAGVLGRRVEQDADVASRVGDLGVAGVRRCAPRPRSPASARP